MPRPKLKATVKRNKVVFIKIRTDEKAALDTLSARRRKAKLKRWTASDIMRDAFLFYLAAMGKAHPKVRVKLPKQAEKEVAEINAQLATG